MRVGIVLPMFSGDAGKALAAAREAEALGFDGVFAFDHFFPPAGSPERPALEAFTTLGAVAAVTERVTLGTLVTRASLRPAGLLAKTAAWLDAASDGRLVLGIGTGDPIDRPEHRAYGIRMLDKSERRAHLEETLTALRAMFRGDRFEGSDWVPPLEGPLRPPPARPGGPPLWVGGQAEEVIRMAGRLADGWNGWGEDPPRFARKVEVLRETAGTRTVEPTWAGIVLVGRDQAETQELAERRRARGIEDHAWTGTAPELARFLRDLEGAGASWAIMVMAGPADRRRLVAETVLPEVVGATGRTRFGRRTGSPDIL
jgi:alkanesulfonate monooxygenase SsuD/methylene tetrahydromethanopterin reductase-like flavin-dependent oxidoreductase (luciferase family)